MKAVWRRKFITVSVHVKKSEKLQINGLFMYPRALEKQEKAKAQIRWKVIIRSGQTLTTWKWTQINEAKRRVFEKINKIEKPLANLNKEERSLKLTKLEMKRKPLQKILMKFRTH